MKLINRLILIIIVNYTVRNTRKTTIVGHTFTETTGRPTIRNKTHSVWGTAAIGPCFGTVRLSTEILVICPSVSCGTWHALYSYSYQSRPRQIRSRAKYGLHFMIKHPLSLSQSSTIRMTLIRKQLSNVVSLTDVIRSRLVITGERSINRFIDSCCI